MKEKCRKTYSELKKRAVPSWDSSIWKCPACTVKELMPLEPFKSECYLYHGEKSGFCTRPTIGNCSICQDPGCDQHLKTKCQGCDARVCLKGECVRTDPNVKYGMGREWRGFRCTWKCPACTVKELMPLNGKYCTYDPKIFPGASLRPSEIHPVPVLVFPELGRKEDFKP